MSHLQRINAKHFEAEIAQQLNSCITSAIDGTPPRRVIEAKDLATRFFAEKGEEVVE